MGNEYRWQRKPIFEQQNRHNRHMGRSPADYSFVIPTLAGLKNDSIANMND